MPLQRLGILAAFAGLVVLCGCGTTPAPPPHAMGASAEQVIRTYYDSMAAQDASATDALRTPRWRKEMALATDPSNPKIDAATIKIGPLTTITPDFTRPDYLKDYVAIRQAYVTFNALAAGPYRQVGPSAYFIMVVKETSSSPWRVDSEGTGP